MKLRAVAQGESWESISKRKEEDMQGKENSSVVHSTTFYIGIAVTSKNSGDVGPRRLDIFYPTTELTQIVRTWEKFDDATMGVVVRHVKSSALPDYVFEDGQRQKKPGRRRPKPTKGSGPHNISPELPNTRHRLVHNFLHTVIPHFLSVILSRLCNSAIEPVTTALMDLSITQPLPIDPAAEAGAIVAGGEEDRAPKTQRGSI